MTQEEATTALVAECQPLLAIAEQSPALFPTVEAQLIALLHAAGRAGLCSRVVIFRLSGRLQVLRNMAAGLHQVATPRRPRLG